MREKEKMTEKKQDFEPAEQEEYKMQGGKHNDENAEKENRSPADEKQPLSFGSYFSELLAAKEVSVDALFEETRIQKKYLLALQKDNFDAFEAPVLIKGFLRSIANALDVPQEEIISHYDAYLHSLKKEKGTLEETFPVQEQKAPVVSIFTVLFSLFILLLLVGLFQFIFPSEEKNRPEVQTATPSGQTGVNGNTETETAGSPQKQEEKSMHNAGKKEKIPVAEEKAELNKKNFAAKSSASKQAENKPQQPLKEALPQKKASAAPDTAGKDQEKIKQEKALQVRFYSLNRSWVQVQADDRPPANFFINSQATPVIRASEKVVLQIGNVSATELYVNGKNIALPSTPSDVVHNFVISRENLSSLPLREKPLDRSKAVSPKDLPPLKPPPAPPEAVKKKQKNTQKEELREALAVSSREGSSPAASLPSEPAKRVTSSR